MPSDRALRALVVYRSKEGQTARVAERIGSVLRSHGAVVDIETADDRPSADPLAYDVVIVGDSIHLGSHSRSLRRWLRRNRTALGLRPVAVFQVSLTSAIDDADHCREADRMLGDLLRGTSVRPVATGLFAGALAYTRYGWFLRRLMRRIAATDGHSTDTSADHEFTDWAAVERFASDAWTVATGRVAGVER